MKPDSSRTVYEGKQISVAVERWGENVREVDVALGIDAFERAVLAVAASYEATVGAR